MNCILEDYWPSPQYSLCNGDSWLISTFASEISKGLSRPVYLTRKIRIQTLDHQSDYILWRIFVVARTDNKGFSAVLVHLSAHVPVEGIPSVTMPAETYKDGKEKESNIIVDVSGEQD